MVCYVEYYKIHILILSLCRMHFIALNRNHQNHGFFMIQLKPNGKPDAIEFKMIEQNINIGQSILFESTTLTLIFLIKGYISS